MATTSSTPFTEFANRVKQLTSKGYSMEGYTFGEDGFKADKSSFYKSILKPDHRRNGKRHLVDELFRRFDARNVPAKNRPPRNGLTEEQTIRHLRKNPLPEEEVEEVRFKIDAIKSAIETKVATHWAAYDVIYRALKKADARLEEAAANGGAVHNDRSTFPERFDPESIDQELEHGSEEDDDDRNDDDEEDTGMDLQ